MQSIFARAYVAGTLASRRLSQAHGQQGQGTVEYVGLILLVALLMVGMVAAMKGFQGKQGLELADRGEDVDVQAHLMRFTVDCTASLAFGIDVNTVEGEDFLLGTKIEHIFPAIMRRMASPLPYWRWMSLPVDRRRRQAAAGRSSTFQLHSSSTARPALSSTASRPARS